MQIKQAENREEIFLRVEEEEEEVQKKLRSETKRMSEEKGIYG